MTDVQLPWRWVRIALASATSAAVVLAAPLAGAQSAPQLSFARDGAASVVSYRIIPGELASTGGISVQIYGDGRVVTQYPAPFTRRGTWELRLSPGELDQLLQSLATKGVVDFDPAAVRAAKREADAARRAAAAAGGAPTVFAVSDPDTIELEIRLERYRPAGVALAEQRNVVKTTGWTGLEADKRQYPDIAALQGLAAADQELRGLMDRSDFVKVD